MDFRMDWPLLFQREQQIVNLQQEIEELKKENHEFKAVIVMNNMKITQLKSELEEETNLKEDYKGILENEEKKNDILQADIVNTVGKMQKKIDEYENVIARSPLELAQSQLGYDRMQKYTKDQVVCMSNRMNRVPDYFMPRSSERKRTKEWKKQRVVAAEATMKQMKKHLLGNFYDDEEEMEKEYDGTCSRTRPHFKHHPYFKF